jgi:amidase
VTDPSPHCRSLGAAELARRIAARELASAEVVEAFIGRIEAVNPELNADSLSKDNGKLPS